jgi:hypothetical protein
MTRAEYRLHARQIRMLYNQTDAAVRRQGQDWYRREHHEARALAKATGLELRQVCVCLAVLSPRCQWSRVKRACGELLAGQRPAGIFGHNLRKAAGILRSQNGIAIDPRTAPKTWAFWQNLWHPNDPEPVTLDSWMFRAHGLPVSVSFKTYQVLADCYRTVAPEFSLRANQLQATVWLHLKATMKGERNR